MRRALRHLEAERQGIDRQIVVLHAVLDESGQWIEQHQDGEYSPHPASRFCLWAIKPKRAAPMLTTKRKRMKEL